MKMKKMLFALMIFCFVGTLAFAAELETDKSMVSMPEPTMEEDTVSEPAAVNSGSMMTGDMDNEKMAPAENPNMQESMKSNMEEGMQGGMKEGM